MSHQLFITLRFSRTSFSNILFEYFGLVVTNNNKRKGQIRWNDIGSDLQTIGSSRIMRLNQCVALVIRRNDRVQSEKQGKSYLITYIHNSSYIPKILSCSQWLSAISRENIVFSNLKYILSTVLYIYIYTVTKDTVYLQYYSCTGACLV